MDNYKTLITQSTKTSVDSVTGEVISAEEYSSVKVPQTPDFVMAFTRDIGFVANISGGASKLLFGILSEISRSNTIVLVKEIKERIAKKVGLNPNSINPLITNLVKNKVLLREGNERSSIYLINPYFFGKGKWININKLRVSVEYDFINCHKKVDISTEYIDDKDDFIGQLIDNQDVVINEVEKINNLSEKEKIRFLKSDAVTQKNNSIDIEEIPATSIAEIKKSNTEKEDEDLRLKLRLVEAEA